MNGYTIDKDRLRASVAGLAGNEVLIVGDVMVDEYLMGDAERISPEAPVPVVHVTEDRHLVGGAGNVARNVRTLGGTPRLISVCGTGSRAALLRQVLDNEGITPQLVEISGRPTTIKTRVIARQQQMLRIDREDASPVSGAYLDKLLALVEQSLAETRVVVVSDYGKGIVTAAFMERLSAMCSRCDNKPLILVDPKTPNFHLYKGVHMLTPNTKETSEGAGMPAGNREQIRAAASEIFRKLGCDHLLTTLGPQGMALFMTPDDAWHVPTVAQKVYDVTGAGDTVIATVGLCLAAGLPMLESCILANYAAGIVVGQVGAATASPEELRHAIATLDVPQVNRWQ